jgi:hypothetical protein
MPDESRTFPSMPAKSWWALRERFRRTLPAKVDATYIASVLGMTERSAESNILPALRATTLIDAEGKTTDRAVKWRDDLHYKEVCEAIRLEVYPKALLDRAPAESAERGEGGKDSSKPGPVTPRVAKTRAATARQGKEPKVEGPAVEKKEAGGAGSGGSGPSLHLDIQIHISPDTTADQIEQIFAAMGRHLKGL